MLSIIGTAFSYFVFISCTVRPAVVCFVFLLMNSVSDVVNQVLSFAFIVQFSLPHESVGKAGALHIFILVCFWSFGGFRIMFN
jgi:hypothetical protein